MAEEIGSEAGSWGNHIVSEIIYNPLNIILVAVCVVLIYKLFKGRESISPSMPHTPELPPLKRQDMTLEQLKQYDGRNEEGRTCVAVNGKVFDVTRGKRFYGPGGPYQAFAGRDASRGLALFSVDTIKDEYDDLSDLNTMQMESVMEWEMQFTEKYHYVGRLLKPGEEPTDYSEDEETSQDPSQKGSDAVPEKKGEEEKKDN